MVILIVGGAKSGKSMYGQNISKSLEIPTGNLYYVATMNPYDLEDLKRIENHLKDRIGYGFKTIEETKDINKIVNVINENDTVLLDSVTSLVTNEMFTKNKYTGKNEFIEKVEDKIFNDIKEICDKALNVILVTDYLFSDGIIYDCYTEKFRRELGHINNRTAELADVVVESSFGNIIIHKGKEKLDYIKIRGTYQDY